MKVKNSIFCKFLVETFLHEIFCNVFNGFEISVNQVVEIVVPYCAVAVPYYESLGNFLCLMHFLNFNSSTTSLGLNGSGPSHKKTHWQIWLPRSFIFYIIKLST
jgi:hypothetical protein